MHVSRIFMHVDINFITILFTLRSFEFMRRFMLSAVDFLSISGIILLIDRCVGRWVGR